MALYLARRNVQVDVYERRSQVELAHVDQRSFSVTLSKRGLFALQKVDLLDEVMRLVMPLRGRVVHDRDGSTPLCHMAMPTTSNSMRFAAMI